MIVVVSKFINCTLIVVIAVYAVLLVRGHLKGRELKAEHDRLTTEFGLLSVEDESKFLACFISDEKPRRQFLWRVYQPKLPNDFRAFVRGPFGSSASMSGDSGVSREFRGFMRFRIRNHVPELYYNISGTSSVVQFDHRIQQFVAENWDDFEFEILAESEPTVVPPSKLLQLISVRIPDHLHDKLPADLSDRKRHELVTEPLFQVVLGDSALLKDW